MLLLLSSLSDGSSAEGAVLAVWVRGARPAGQDHHQRAGRDEGVQKAAHVSRRGSARRALRSTSRPHLQAVLPCQRNIGIVSLRLVAPFFPFVSLRFTNLPFFFFLFRFRFAFFTPPPPFDNTFLVSLSSFSSA